MKKLLLLLPLMFAGQISGQNIITTVAGNGMPGYSGDGGLATVAKLALPTSITFDSGGNMYIADGNSAIRKVNTSGIITTIAGTGTSGFSGDGSTATTAKIADPTGIVFDGLGNLYIADRGNNRIRKINTSGIINTFAGNGTSGFSGDNGPAISAELNDIFGIATDAAGNLFIADHGNNRIRKVNTSGIITTVVGNGTAGFSGDGGSAALAELDGPTGVAFDALGNMYISDANNNRIRKVNSSGIINTIAGNGTMGFSGDGGLATAAELNIPDPVAIDANGNIYITDYNNNRIRKVNNSGIITTIVGIGTAGYSGDGGQATAAELDMPEGVALDGAGNLFIADYFNMCIRKVTNVAGIGELTDNNMQLFVYPNPTSDQFFIDANTTDKLNVDLYDVNGRHVFSKSVNDKTNINVTTLNNGIYSLTIKTVDRIINKKLVIVH